MNQETQKISSKRFPKILVWILVVALAVLCIGSLLFRKSIETLVYPRKYQEEVENAASRFGLEPNLIYAIIKAESGFCANAVSSASAIGLMQIIPDTFLFDIREHIDLADAHSSALFDPETNILAGTYYFAYWYDYFCDTYGYADPTVEALAAYNAGISNVWRWLDDDELADWTGLFEEKIPWEETRNYVKRILEYKEKYDELYGKAAMANGRISENLCYRWAERYGTLYNIDPRFVMAIIKAESSFDPKIRSNSGATGLMQIIESTYEDIKSDLHLEEEYDRLFEDPEFNVRCGAYYLHWVDERIDGFAEIAAGYNAGAGIVQGWLDNTEYSADGETLIMENIPVEQTRRYVDYVMSYYEEYCARYPE